MKRGKLMMDIFVEEAPTEKTVSLKRMPEMSWMTMSMLNIVSIRCSK